MDAEVPFDYQWIHWARQEEGGCKIISLVRSSVLWGTTTMNRAFMSSLLVSQGHRTQYGCLFRQARITHPSKMYSSCLQVAGWFSSSLVFGIASGIRVGQQHWQVHHSTVIVDVSLAQGMLTLPSPATQTFPHGHLVHFAHHCATGKTLGWLRKRPIRINRAHFVSTWWSEASSKVGTPQWNITWATTILTCQARFGRCMHVIFPGSFCHFN